MEIRIKGEGFSSTPPSSKHRDWHNRRWKKMFAKLKVGERKGRQMKLLPVAASWKGQTRHRRDMRNFRYEDIWMRCFITLPVTLWSNLDPSSYSINSFSLPLTLGKNSYLHFFSMWQKKLWGLFSLCAKPAPNPNSRPEFICWEKSCPRAGSLCQIISRKTKWCWGLRGSYIHFSFLHLFLFTLFCVAPKSFVVVFPFPQIRKEWDSNKRSQKS